MSNEKQQLALAIKQQVALLQTCIDQAEAAGLTIEMDVPSKYMGGGPTKIKVTVIEKVVY